MNLTQWFVMKPVEAKAHQLFKTDWYWKLSFKGNTSYLRILKAWSLGKNSMQRHVTTTHRVSLLMFWILEIYSEIMKQGFASYLMEISCSAITIIMLKGVSTESTSKFLRNLLANACSGWVYPDFGWEMSGLKLKLSVSSF